jgi:hypothetical protein
MFDEKLKKSEWKHVAQDPQSRSQQSNDEDAAEESGSF